jgi:hypothetical protein
MGRREVIGRDRDPHLDRQVEAGAFLRPDQFERRLRARLDALGPAPRAELLHVLMLPDFERADRIGEFWGYPQRAAPSPSS